MKTIPILTHMTWLVASATVAASNYNSFSSSHPRKELRWCKGLDETTRPLSLFYSYFVQSATEYPGVIEPAFLTSLADTVLSCPNNSSLGRHQGTRVLALEVSVEGDSMSTLPNFCDNGVYCHIVLHKMTMAVQGDTREDELLLTQMLDVIDAAMDDTSNAQVSMSLIRDRPAATNAQGFATTQVKESEVGFFTLVLLAVSLMGSMSLFLVLVVRHNSNKNSSEATEDIPRTITLSFDEMPPSDKVLGIRPCNLFEEHFTVTDEEEIHHWNRPILRTYQGGFCIELDTIYEEKELDFDIEESEGSV